MKIANKFYVGQPGVHTNGWAKRTLAEAVEQAQALVAADGRERVVVQMVRVVKQSAPPTSVEKVD